jgi:hypothetical protein
MDDIRYHDMSKSQTFAHLGEKENPLAYEWLYFDAETPDGNLKITINFLAPNAYDPQHTLDLMSHLVQDTPFASSRYVGVFVHVVDKSDPENLRSYTVLDYYRDHSQLAPSLQYTEDTATKTFSLRIGKNTVERLGENSDGRPVYTVKINAKDRNSQVKGSLTFAGIEKGFGTLKDIVRKGEFFHKWAVILPRAHVSGNFVATELSKSESETFEVKKINGYHDKNWGNIPGNVSFQEWIWGRAHSQKGLTLIFADVVNREDNLNPFLHKYLGQVPIAPSEPIRFVYHRYKGERVHLGSDVDFKYGSQTKTAPNGQSYITSYEVVPTTESSLWNSLKVSGAKPYLNVVPYYSQYSARYSFAPYAENEKLIFEKMDLRKLFTHQIKDALSLESLDKHLENKKCTHKIGSCEFYDCRESQAQCGPNGYYLSGGKLFCEAFSKEAKKSNSRFTSKIIAWVPKVARCLQNHVHDWVWPNSLQSQNWLFRKLKSVFPIMRECRAAKAIAIPSHYICYFTTGFCDFSEEEQRTVRQFVLDQSTPEDVTTETEVFFDSVCNEPI